MEIYAIFMTFNFATSVVEESSFASSRNFPAIHLQRSNSFFIFFSYRVYTSKYMYSEKRSFSFSIFHLMTQSFLKLTTMTEVRKNSRETTTFSKLSARKYLRTKIFRKSEYAKAEVPFSKNLQCGNRGFRPSGSGSSISYFK